MSRSTILMVLGIFVALSPFSGLPLSWIEIIVPLLGIAIVVVSYTLRVRLTIPSSK